ncbi:MAG: hypothetical protein ACRC6A_06985 [Fusobacteriaceae bacterium]
MNNFVFLKKYLEIFYNKVYHCNELESELKEQFLSHLKSNINIDNFDSDSLYLDGCKFKQKGLDCNHSNEKETAIIYFRIASMCFIICSIYLKNANFKSLSFYYKAQYLSCKSAIYQNQKKYSHSIIFLKKFIYALDEAITSLNNDDKESSHNYIIWNFEKISAQSAISMFNFNKLINDYYDSNSLTDKKNLMEEAKLQIELAKNKFSNDRTFIKNLYLNKKIDPYRFSISEGNCYATTASFYQCFSILLQHEDPFLTIEYLLKSSESMLKAIESNSKHIPYKEGYNSYKIMLKYFLEKNNEIASNLYSTFKHNTIFLEVFSSIYDINGYGNITINNSGTINNNGIIGNNNLIYQKK